MLKAASSNCTSPDMLHVRMDVYIGDNVDAVCDWEKMPDTQPGGISISGFI